MKWLGDLYEREKMTATQFFPGLFCIPIILFCVIVLIVGIGRIILGV
jgi:hypothetical protein